MSSHRNTARRAAKLPAPIPGQVITIPLELLPDYLLANGLRAMGPGEVHAFELAHRLQKPDGLLWVQRESGDE